MRDNISIEDTEYGEPPPENKKLIQDWITTVVCIVIGVLEVIIGLRFFLRLLGANPDSIFSIALYGLSGVFLSPFNGTFNNLPFGSQNVFEPSDLIAMLVYGLLAVLVVVLVVIACEFILPPLLSNNWLPNRLRRINIQIHRKSDTPDPDFPDRKSDSSSRDFRDGPLSDKFYP